MKEKKLLFCVVVLLLIFGMTHAQKLQTVEDEYAAYFTLPREALYLHLNKTTFLKGEEIWFKGYTYDQKNQLSSKATTNINVGVYDAAGNQLKKALFKAENGVTQGSFAIDSTFSGGTYYVKASTNWMKNFKENDAFVQKIEIISEEEAAATSETTATKNYDFQFLPEGGHIVVNTLSNVGFKVIDENGKGVSVSGIVYNTDRKQVASFESNTLGMGKFLFQPKEGQNYTAEIQLEDGTFLTEVLPTAKDRGISMVLNNPFEDKVILNFSTNQQTLAYPQNRTYKVLIHQNGNLKTIDLQLDSTEKSISIFKKELFKGVNTLTVFDANDNPVLERLFFNDYFVQKTVINVSKLNTINDSILLSLNELNLENDANISISVLPENTKSYQPQHNILSNFYLKPHVKGFIENPQYYFQDMDRKKKYELDILLLTQGWSRYDWNDIFESKPNALNRFENGITIDGRVNKPATSVQQLFIHATKNHPAVFIDLDKNQRFQLTNLFLEEDEEVRFSYVTANGKMKKPSMYLRFLIQDSDDKISLNYISQLAKMKSNTADFTVPKNFFEKEAEALETVVIEAKKENPKFSNLFLNNPKVTEITMEEYNRYPNIVEFINFNGFNAQQSLDGKVYIASRIPNAGVPAVFYNDMRVTDFDILFNISLAAFERVAIDRYSVASISDKKSLGVIKLYARETQLFPEATPKAPYLQEKTTVFFASPKKYYMPKYASFSNPMFGKYGAISWIPELKLTNNEVKSFKIFDTKTENITLYIEGISENGDLISTQKTVQVR